MACTCIRPVTCSGWSIGGAIRLSLIHIEMCIRDRDVPVPEIGDDDILVEVKGCGICGGDYKRYMGPEHGGWYKMHLPVITGHEFAGVIAKLGRNVDKYWKVGDRIVSDNTGDACGRCPTCAPVSYTHLL